MQANNVGNDPKEKEKCLESFNDLLPCPCGNNIFVHMPSFVAVDNDMHPYPFRLFWG